MRGVWLGTEPGTGSREAWTLLPALPPSPLCDLDSLSFLICTVTGAGNMPALPPAKDWMRGARAVSCDTGSWSIMHEGWCIADPRRLSDTRGRDEVGDRTAWVSCAGSRTGPPQHESEPLAWQERGKEARADRLLRPKPERLTPCRSGLGRCRRGRQCLRALARGRCLKGQSRLRFPSRGAGVPLPGAGGSLRESPVHGAGPTRRVNRRPVGHLPLPHRPR